MPPVYNTSGDDVITSEYDYTDEEREFLMAVEAYKKQTKRRFPTWVEILKIAHSLGYKKVAEPTDLPIFKKQPNKWTSTRYSTDGKSIRTEQGEESPPRKAEDGTAE